MSSRENRKLVFSIASELDAIESTCQNIGRMVEEAGYSELVFSIQMLAHEALNNAHYHGNRCVPQKLITGSFSLGRVWWELIVEDEGEGFKRPRSIQLPSIDSESGRGLMLMKLYSESVQFNRKGNRVTLRQRILRSTTDV